MFENLPAALFSPAKIVFIGYLVLVALGRLETTKWEIIIFSLLFLVVEIFHNDYLRIKLNNLAQQKQDKQKIK